MSGFVVCQSCGTRIKAGRGHCLRCFEPLPDPDAPLPTPLSVSLGLVAKHGDQGRRRRRSRRSALLALVIWQTWPVPAEDEAQSASLPAVAAAPAPAHADRTSPTPARRTAAAPPNRTRRPADPDPDLEATRADYEQKLTARPKDADLWNKLGQLLERMGRTDDAAGRFEHAVTLAPLEPAYRVNLARRDRPAGAVGPRHQPVPRGLPPAAEGLRHPERARGDAAEERRRPGGRRRVPEGPPVESVLHGRRAGAGDQPRKGGAGRRRHSGIPALSGARPGVGGRRAGEGAPGSAVPGAPSGKVGIEPIRRAGRTP